MYINVIVKALIRVFFYDRHVVTFWQEMQFVQGHVTLLLVKQQFLEELVAMNFQRHLSTWSMVKGLKYMHFSFFMFIIVMRGDLRQYSVSNAIMTNLQFPVPSSEPKLDQQNRNWEVGTEIELTEQKLRS